jgi:hypothetical protein
MIRLEHLIQCNNCPCRQTIIDYRNPIKSIGRLAGVPRIWLVYRTYSEIKCTKHKINSSWCFTGVVISKMECKWATSSGDGDGGVDGESEILFSKSSSRVKLRLILASGLLALRF